MYGIRTKGQIIILPTNCLIFFLLFDTLSQLTLPFSFLILCSLLPMLDLGWKRQAGTETPHWLRYKTFNHRQSNMIQCTLVHTHLWKQSINIPQDARIQVWADRAPAPSFDNQIVQIQSLWGGRGISATMILLFTNLDTRHPLFINPASAPAQHSARFLY